MSERSELMDRVRHRLVSDGSRDLAGLAAALRAESGGIVDDVVFDRLRRDAEADLRGRAVWSRCSRHPTSPTCW